MDYAKMLESIQKGVDGLATCTADLTKGLKEQAELLKVYGARIEALEKAPKTPGGRSVKLPGVNEGKETFSFARACAAIAARDEKIAPFEMEVMKQAAKKRDLSSDVDSAGGYIVPEEYVAELIELLRPKMIVTDLGATQLSGLSGGSVKIPKQTGGATAYWVAEAGAITKSQQALGMIELKPRELAGLTVMSGRLLRQSNPSVEAMVREDLAAVLARARDLAALRGTGGLQPLGVTNTPSINTRSIAAVPSIDDLYEMMYEVELDNADVGSLGWAMHPRTWNTIRKIKDGDGRYLINPDPTNSPQRGTLLGFPYRTTTQIPINLGAGTNQSQIFFGNWKDLVVAEWLGLELAASDQTSDAFEKNQVWIRAILETDCAVRHAESFCLDSTVQA